MESDSEIVSIRCPGHRPHGIYDQCGKILASFDNNYLYIYCSDCKTYYKVSFHENMNVDMQALPKNERLVLVNNLKAVF